MITEKEVLQAIDECMCEPITGGKRSALADLIIIQEYLFGSPKTEPERYEPPEAQYSTSPGNDIETKGGSEFLDAVNGRNSAKVWSIVDELVSAVKVLHPRMYDSFIDKIYDL